MTRVVRKSTAGVLLIGLMLAGAGPASGQHSLSGEVGVDTGLYSFTNNIFADGFKYDSDRRMANQYLDLSARGPLGNSYFAGYNAMIRLRTTQIRSEVDNDPTTEHLGPDITNYHGELSFFPSRPFPLKIFTGRSEENTVRYEPSNRSEIDQVDPGLSVVRRYATVNEETGAQWRWSLTRDFEVGVEAKQTLNQLTRQYDFDENRNIWVDFQTISPGVAPFYDISVVNTIPDRDVLLYVNFAFVDTVKAAGTIDLNLEEGLTDLDFVPVGLNAYHDRIDIRSDMQWKIFFNDPPGSKDLDQTNDIVTARLKYGQNTRFRDDAYFEYNDGDESVQDMTTGLRTFNNMATYDISPDASLSSLTTYTSNLTDVGVVSHQLSNLFMQQTSAKWRRRRGISTRVAHSYSHLTSDTGTDLVKSDNNIVNATAIMPTNWHGHEASLRLNGNFLSDNKGFVNNLVSAELGNRMRFRGAGFRWRPRHTFKRTGSTSKNPDGTSDELDSKLIMEGNHPDLWVLGDLRLKGEYDWRRKVNHKGIDTEDRYVAEVGVMRRFGPAYRLMATAGVDREDYDFKVVDTDIELQPRPDELRRTLRMDLQAMPLKAFSAGLNGMWITTRESRITKYSVSVRFIVPYIGLPVRSFMIKERRELDGLRPQELLQLETKLNYNFRKIRLEVSHRLTDETLTTENYVYSEFLGKITRAFDVY